MNKVYSIFGPNLNMLGYRDKKDYGNLNYDQLCNVISDYANDLNIEVEIFQSNGEKEIIEFIHDLVRSSDDFDIIVNLGAFTHYSYAISDAISMLKNKCNIIEVHLSNIEKREEFRKLSVLEHVRTNVFFGEKEKSYFKALRYIKENKI